MTKNLSELNKGIIIQIQEAKLIPSEKKSNLRNTKVKLKTLKEKNLKAAMRKQINFKKDFFQQEQ